VIVDALNNKVKKHHLRNLNLAENHISSIGAGNLALHSVRITWLIGVSAG